MRYQANRTTQKKEQKKNTIRKLFSPSLSSLLPKNQRRRHHQISRRKKNLHSDIEEIWKFAALTQTHKHTFQLARVLIINSDKCKSENKMTVNESLNRARYIYSKRLENLTIFIPCHVTYRWHLFSKLMDFNIKWQRLPDKLGNDVVLILYFIK